MNRFIKSITFILLIVALMSCEGEGKKYHLDSLAPDTYYSSEIIPADYLKIYGKWKLYDISGGFSGAGYEPDYDYLEIKSVGIYGLLRNDKLFEFGKIELYNFDERTTDFLQIRFIPDPSAGNNPNMFPPEKYLELRGNDTLTLYSPCCDMYNHHYKRVK